GKWVFTPAGGMYEAPQSRAREARGTHRDVGRAHLWWWQRLEGQRQQESRVGLEEPRLGLEEPRFGLQESRVRLQEPQERLEELICAAIRRPGELGRLVGFRYREGDGAGNGAAQRL